MQTSKNEPNLSSDGGEANQAKAITSSGIQLSILEEVIDRATSRNEIQREIDGQLD